ncbi:Aerobic glycerol-3-phosphate dehydrogenase [Trichinella spiralis]|uniref:Aerobic glycerol-3-phosphate dehydrogenase n=1 Tax=Trichinella spiralis TaxID=6334 RepID=A0ABR3KHN1_TRISP
MSAEPADVIKAGNAQNVSDETSTKSTVTNVDQRLLNDAWYLITADFVAEKVHSTLFMHKTKQRYFYEALEKYERNLNFDQFIERVVEIFNSPPALNSPLPFLLLLFMKPKDLFKSKFQSQYWHVKKALDVYKSMIFSTQNRGQRLKLKNFFRNRTHKPLDVYFNELLKNIDRIGSWHEILKTLCPDMKYKAKSKDLFEKADFVQDESGEPVFLFKGEPCLWRKFRQGENGQLLYRVDGIELPMDVEYYDEITVSKRRSANSRKNEVGKHGGMESKESSQDETAASSIHENVDMAALEACLPAAYFEWAARCNRQTVLTSKRCHDEKPEQVQKNPDDIADNEFVHNEMKQQQISDSVDNAEGSFFGKTTEGNIAQYVNMDAGPSNFVLLQGNFFGNANNGSLLYKMNSNNRYIESVDHVPVTSFSGVAVYNEDNINAVYSQPFAFTHANDIMDFPGQSGDSLGPIELSDIEVTTDFTFDNYMNDPNLNLESVIAQTGFLSDNDIPTCSRNLLAPSIMFNEPTTTEEADGLAESHYMPPDFTETSPVDIPLGMMKLFQLCSRTLSNHSAMMSLSMII